MAVVDFINTFRIQAPDAIDSRFVLADAQARYDYPLGALYEGLVTYQEDTGILYVLTDIDNKDTDTGWSRVTEDTIVSAETGETKPNGFRDLIFTLTDGTTLTVDNAFRDGVKGNDGATGAQGARGEKGQTGLPGIQGQQGLPGTDGINGQDGTNGTDGTDGIDGSQGARGEQGLPGTPGTDGTDGMDGQQGIPGTNGTDGSDGQPGKDGAMGNTGPAGSDASVTKTNVDLALEIGDASQDFYYNNDGNWVKLLDPTKGQIDDAIGANPGTNDPRKFYAEDGQFRTPTGSGGGTNVVANPTGVATEALSKLEVGDIVYGIQGGSSSGPDFGNILLQGTISFEGIDGIDVNGATADYLTYTNLTGSPYYRIFTADGTGETITINAADASVPANIYQSKTY